MHCFWFADFYGIEECYVRSTAKRHFLLWAFTQGQLPAGGEHMLNFLSKLLVVATYWSFALILPPAVRSAFSAEFLGHISSESLPERLDLSTVYLSPLGALEDFNPYAHAGSL